MQGLNLFVDALKPDPAGFSHTNVGMGTSSMHHRHAGSSSPDDVLRVLGRVLVLPLNNTEGKYRTPVVTLHTTETSNLYGLIERSLLPEYNVGADKFWKIIRADLNLETWRPRVHGTQLKALTNCRLPEQPEEFAAVESQLSAIPHVLRPGVTPQSFVQDLKRFVAGVEVWWESRNARRPTGDVGTSAGNLKRSSAAVGGGSSSYVPPVKQQNVGQGTSRRAPNPESNGIGSQPSGPIDVGMPPSAPADINMLMRGAAPFLSPLSVPQNTEPPTVVNLNVGGKSYATTSHTLLAAPHSFFWDILATGPQGEPPVPPLRNQNGEIFIDRNGKLFAYVLEHLRALANGESASPLPEDSNELAALAREAEYYNLPTLLDRISSTAIMPQPNTRAMYDSIYLETGFNSIEGPGLKEMEQRKILVMQQMNHVLAQKALDGFFVAACDCGVNHREVEDGGMHHNLFYHILLKRVMPVTPSLHPPEIQLQHPGTSASALQRQIQAAAALGNLGAQPPPPPSSSGGPSLGMDLSNSLPSPHNALVPALQGTGSSVVGPPLPLQLQGGPGLQGPPCAPSPLTLQPLQSGSAAAPMLGNPGGGPGGSSGAGLVD